MTNVQSSSDTLEFHLAKDAASTGTRCVCGHIVGYHIFDYGIEEFAGCQLCTNCPSHERFFKKED